LVQIRSQSFLVIVVTDTQTNACKTYSLAFTGRINVSLLQP